MKTLLITLAATLALAIPSSSAASIDYWQVSQHFYTSYMKLDGSYSIADPNCVPIDGDTDYCTPDLTDADVVVRLMRFSRYDGRFHLLRTFREESFGGSFTMYFWNWQLSPYLYSYSTRSRPTYFRWSATLVDPYGEGNSIVRGDFQMWHNR